MPRGRFLVCSFLAALAAGCSLPSRNNPFDRVNAPSVTLSVRLDGADVVQGHRGDGLRFHVEGKDPQGDPIYVLISQHDPATGGCHGPDTPIAALTLTTAGEVAWTDHPGVCFEPGPDGRPLPQPLQLEAVARDPSGNQSTTVIDFSLVDAPPIADAGADLWLDPTWTTTAILSAARSFDPDGAFDGALNLEWSQVGGPPMTVATGGEIAVSLDAAKSDLYRFALTVCDPWNACATSAPISAHLTRALWARTNDGLALLDPQSGEAKSVRAAAGGLAPLPRLCSNIWALPAYDGVSILAPQDDSATAADDSKIAWQIGHDLVLRSAPLPAGLTFAQRLGAAPSLDESWFLATDSTNAYHVLQIGPGSVVTATGQSSTSFSAVAAVTQYSPSTPRWSVGNDGTNVFLREDGNTSANFTLPLGQNVNCLFGPVHAAAGAPDGSVWFVTDDAAMHVGTDGVPLSCHQLAFGSIPVAAAWMPGLDGAGSLVVGYSTRGTLIATDSAVEDGPAATVSEGGLRYDADDDSFVVAGAGGVARFADGTDTPLALAPAPQDVCGQSFSTQIIGLALDGAGSVWGVKGGNINIPADPGRIERLPRSLSPGALVGDLFPTVNGEQSTDFASGRLWQVRPDPDRPGASMAVAFDDRGPAPDPKDRTRPWHVPLPGAPVEKMVFDPGDCLPGQQSGCRAPGFWVSTHLFQSGPAVPMIVRVGLDGSMAVKTVAMCQGQYAGNPNPANGVLGLALVPADGSVWTTNTATGVTCDDRYFLDGSVLEYADGASAILDYVPARQLQTVVDKSGNYWTVRSVSPHRKVVKRAPNGAETLLPPSTEICASGTFTYPGAIAVDPVSGDVMVSCFDTDFSGAQNDPLIELDRITGAGVAVGSPIAASALSSATLGADGMYFDGETGAFWFFPSAPEILSWDGAMNAMPARAAPIAADLVSPVSN